MYSRRPIASVGQLELLGGDWPPALWMGPMADSTWLAGPHSQIVSNLGNETPSRKPHSLSHHVMSEAFGLGARQGLVCRGGPHAVIPGHGSSTLRSRPTVPVASPFASQCFSRRIGAVGGGAGPLLAVGRAVWSVRTYWVASSTPGPARGGRFLIATNSLEWAAGVLAP